MKLCPWPRAISFLIPGMSAGFSPLGCYFTAPRPSPPPLSHPFSIRSSLPELPSLTKGHELPNYKIWWSAVSLNIFCNCTHTFDRMTVTECSYASLRAARLVEALFANGVFDWPTYVQLIKRSIYVDDVDLLWIVAVNSWWQ